MDNTLAQETSGGNRITAVGVLDRSVALLDLLAAGPRSLRVLAETSGLPRPTAHRLLVALEAHRLVGREPDGRFRLGPRLTELAVRAGWGLDLAGLAGPVLAQLHQQTGESAQLYLRSGDRRLCAAACDAGSGGKVLLAFGPDGDRFPAVPAAELAAIARRGWSASNAERQDGVSSVSAPILAGQELLGALCVSGPASRLTQAACRQLAPVVIAAAGELCLLAGS